MSLELAVQAALHGPERRRLTVMGHPFNVKPAAILRLRTKITADGEIEHYLPIRPDDRVTYNIDKTRNVLNSLELRRHGRLNPPLPPLPDIIGAPLTQALIDGILQDLGRRAAGDWVPACQAIVLAIAFRL